MSAKRIHFTGLCSGHNESSRHCCHARPPPGTDRHCGFHSSAASAPLTLLTCLALTHLQRNYSRSCLFTLRRYFSRLLSFLIKAGVHLALKRRVCALDTGAHSPGAWLVNMVQKEGKNETASHSLNSRYDVHNHAFIVLCPKILRMTLYANDSRRNSNAALLDFVFIYQCLGNKSRNFLVIFSLALDIIQPCKYIRKVVYHDIYYLFLS